MGLAKKPRISAPLCRACEATVRHFGAVQAAQQELLASPPELLEQVRAAAGWDTLRGRGGRRRRIEGLLREGGNGKRRGHPALTLADWRVAALAVALHLVIEHWRECPDAIRGGPYGALAPHVQSLPSWLQEVWRRARRALAADDHTRFLARKNIAVEDSVAALLGISRRSVQRRFTAFMGARNGTRATTADRP